MPDTRKVFLQVESSRSTSRGLLRGIMRYVQLYGSWELRRVPPYYFPRQQVRQLVKELMQWGVQGVIAEAPSELHELLDLGVPCVSAVATDSPTAYLPMLVDDEQSLARMVFEHFRQRGFVHYAFCGLAGYLWSERRKAAFESEVKSAGFDCHVKELSARSIMRMSVEQRDQLSKWLVSLPKPLALYACNDECAEYALTVCGIAGLRSPYQVAILGVDDDEMICELSSPTLSSVALKDEYGGFEAAALLDRMMVGQEKMASQRIIVGPSHISVRQSTDIVAVSCTEVVKAIEFIHKNAHKPIQVVDVVEACACSRRQLERLFRHHLGMSIHDHIRHSRLKQVVRLLLETDESIQRIAYQLGFPGIEQLDRFFRQGYGISPSAFRKQNIKR